jgi:virginiamycin B lyase
VQGWRAANGFHPGSFDREPFAMEEAMQSGLKLSLAAGAALLFLQAPVHAQGTAAISGQVTSEAEGGMEGVVVTARKAGAKFTVSVVTDAQGRYNFPANRLEPGQYALTIRAVGFDLNGKASADVAAEKTANVDLKLDKTKKLAAQLSNAEWMASIPGTEEQKAPLLNCVGCHTLERVVRSSHDADQWTHIVHRMLGYAAVSQPIKPQRLNDPERAGTPEQYRRFAEYLATINLSGTSNWEYSLKPMPRAKGQSTRVIVTEYDLARPTTEPHDIVVKDGAVWYTDFGEPFITKFEPKTMKITEYPVKIFKPNHPVGLLDLGVDQKGTFWFDTMYQASLANLDPKTGEIKYYPLAEEFNNEGVQMNFVGLRHDVDGKVWTKNVPTGEVFRVDLATQKWERFEPLKQLSNGKRNTIYQLISDSQNNAWVAEFVNGYLGKIDAKTTKVTWYQLPTANARARRMRIDDQDRIWVTEYRGNKVAMFDTKEEKFVEYPLPAHTYPYRSAVDKNGEIWTGGMHTDRIVRFDPKTNRTLEYPLPSTTNIRSVWMDDTTTPPTLWTGSNHGAALVKVEPLD